MSSDIYIYNIDDDSLENITNDWFSDVQISWHPNGEELLFISDRGNHLQVGFMSNSSNFLDHNVENLDIYKINIFEENIFRLTDTVENETYACYAPDKSKIAFISDKSGVNNIYISDINGESSQPVTNIMTGVTQLNWISNNQLIFTGFYKSGYDIFILSNINRLLNDNIEISPSNWKKNNNMVLLKKSKSNNSKSKSYQNYIFDGRSQTQNTINIFDESLLKDNNNNYIKNKYNTRFTLDYAQAYYSYDSYYGSQAMAMFLFSDILGDHRITLGTEMQIDFKESDYYLSYRYLKNKINHDISFYHQAYKTDIYATFDYSSYQFTLNRNIGLNYLFFLPFSRFDRLEGGLSYNHLIKEESEINTFSGNESTLELSLIHI